MDLYGLHATDATKWNAAALGEKFGVEESLVANILKFTSVPRILPTKVGPEGNMPPEGVPPPGWGPNQ